LGLPLKVPTFSARDKTAAPAAAGNQKLDQAARFKVLGAVQA
jgi:hypothetical protein